MIAPPESSEHSPYHWSYIALVGGQDIVQTAALEGRAAGAFYGSLTEEQGGLRYAPGKWSIKEVLGHVIDTERILAYRALRIGRGDQTDLPGFEQDDYVASAHSNARAWADLASEFTDVRQGSARLLKSFPDDAWMRRGTANGMEITARALAYIITGHEMHHRKILRERYLGA